MDPFAVVAIAFWVMLPAYIPNNAAVLAGGGRPIDAGSTWRDGKRILGDGKTWRGTIVGIAAGAVFAAILNTIQPSLANSIAVPLPHFPVAAVLTLPSGAMLGDILASFIKRRTGRQRGAAFPLLDQLDFVVIALLLTAIAAPSWFTATFTLPVLLTILVLTPVLHVTTNIAAYYLGFKEEPW